MDRKRRLRLASGPPAVMRRRLLQVALLRKQSVLSTYQSFGNLARRVAEAPAEQDVTCDERKLSERLASGRNQGTAPVT